MNRFFLNPECIQDNRVIFPVNSAAQIRRVLRLESGAMVMVLDNAGSQYQVRLEKVDTSAVEGIVLSKQPVEGEALTRLSLFCALTQREKLEWIIQKATEAGVAEIHFFSSRRSLVKHTDFNPAKLERWQAIAREAAEQCARGCIPLVHPPVPFEKALEIGKQYPIRMAGWEAEETLNLSAYMREVNDCYPVNQDLNVAVFVGPEGGFDPLEVDVMRAADVKLVSVGARVLRVETAALLIPVLILYERGGFNL